MSSPQAVLSRDDSPASEYQYNYTEVKPLAMSQGVPKSEQAPKTWWLQAVLQMLHIANNRMRWMIEQTQREQGGAVSSVSSQILDLSHLGVGALDLRHLDKLPAPATLGEKLLEDVSHFGEAARLAEQSAQLAEKAFAGELGNLFDVFKHLLDAATARPKGRPHSMQDYFNLFVTLPLPAAAHVYEEDSTFAWMRVAGFNPLVLRKALALEDALGLADAALSAVLGEGDTVAQALAEGRLFLADYKALARATNGNFPNGPKYVFAPRALFGLPRGSGPRQLKPLGIRCGQDPSGYPLYTPADGEAWLQAKTVVNVADVSYHELISHLGHTHLLVEPFVIATHRTLPDDHPVSLLLRPHFQGTMYINDLAQSHLIAPGGKVDMLLGGTIDADRTVAVESLLADPDFDFNRGMLPRALALRGVEDKALDYPYREDALLVWSAIEKWVSAYVGHHYVDDAAVAGDVALRAWSAELVADNGGRVKGFGEDGVSGQLTTREYLIQALTMLVFTGSAQHAAVNFAQAGIMTFVPLAPGAAYRAAPATRGDAALNPALDQYPPLDMAAEQLDFLTLLGSLYHGRLGDYPVLWFKNLEIDAHLLAFKAELHRIGGIIEQRNTTRPLPYPYFIPAHIPQSINI